MPPKKGLTQEEKLSALLNWFQSDHMFYTLKEIECKAKQTMQNTTHANERTSVGPS